MSDGKNRGPYHEIWPGDPEWVEDPHACEEYSRLVGPNGFECILGEPEDRTWSRDGRDVVERLNRLHHELHRATSLARDLAGERDRLQDILDERAGAWAEVYAVTKKVQHVLFHLREEIREHGSHEISADKERVKAHHQGQTVAYKHACEHIGEILAMLSALGAKE